MFIYLILALLQANKLSDNRFKKHSTIQQYVYITCLCSHEMYKYARKQMQLITYNP